MALRCSEPDCKAAIKNLGAPVVIGGPFTLGNIILPNRKLGRTALGFPFTRIVRGNGVLRCTVCAMAMALERTARDVLGGVAR